MKITRHRPIRSFVRREGRLTAAQAKALNTPTPHLIEITTTPLNFVALFKNAHPVILEVGFGMGQSLLEQAKQHLEKNFLGVEVHRPGVGALLSHIEKEGMKNICIIAEDIALLLDKIPSESLEGVQIFFPDPWPKKRHHKRRLMQEKFLAQLAPKIKPGGYLHCATDWEDYAHHTLKVIEASQQFRNTSSAGSFVPRPESRPMTKFERRGLKLGHGVWDLVYIKN